MIVFLGWFGSILYLLNHAYISVVKNWNSKVYYAGNLIAALSLVVSSMVMASYQAVVINSFWAVISVLLLIQFDVAKLAFSKRLFYLGFVLFVGFSLWVANTQGIYSLAFHTYLGWSSSYVFCLSYFLFCSKKMSHIQYLVFNVYAATALLPLLWTQENWPVFTLEICWALISAYGVVARLDEVHLID